MGDGDAERDDSADAAKAVKLAVFLGFAAITAILLRNAWVCDDAYITFRTSFNLAEGDGAVWNVGERVQAYSNPLWMLLMTVGYGVSGEFYYTAVLAGVAMTLVASWIIAARLAASRAAALLALVVLFSSKAFVDYSTSGLENPLTHLILVCFAWYLLASPHRGPRRLFWLYLLASAGALDRLDAILFFVPALVGETWRVRREPWVRAALLGLAPLILWELFSIVYYGFPFPNTYYAKLGVQVPLVDRLHQGWIYLLDSLNRDPITLTGVAAAVAAVAIEASRERLMLVGGMLLYLAYVVWIGGDHMTGRFLTGPLAIAAVLVAGSRAASLRPYATVAAAAVFIFGMMMPFSPLRANATYNEVERIEVRSVRISDERHFYYDEGGLLRDSVGKSLPTGKWVGEGLSARTEAPRPKVRGPIGYYGFFAGPRVHVIDEFGLADPLLARLPARWHYGTWRAGHFRRHVPAGYVDGIGKKTNGIEDERLRRYYDKVRLVTHGSLFSGERWAAIWNLNTGGYDHLIDRSAYQWPTHVVRELSAMPAPVAKHSTSRGPGLVLLDGNGKMLRVELGEVRTARRLEIAVDSNDDYLIVFMRDQREVARLLIRQVSARPGPMYNRVLATTGMIPWGLQVPAGARDGFDEVRVAPTRGDGKYAVGHLTLIGD